MKIHMFSYLTVRSGGLRGFILPVLLCLLLWSVPARAQEPAPQLAPCLSCHTAERICRNLSRSGGFWTETVKRMIDKGAHVGPDQAPDLIKLLSNPDHEKVRQILNCPPLDKPHAKENAVPAALRLAHPLLMATTLLLALWVAWQGIQRVRFTLFRHKALFNWKGHVRFGLVVMALWLLGMVAGSIMTALIYGQTGVYGVHRTTAMVMLPLILFGGASGLYMDRKKAPRKLLPLLHGAANLILVLLALGQLATGLAIVGRIFSP